MNGYPEIKKIKIYIKLNEHNEIVNVDSEVFLRDTTGWIEIDEGIGDRYSHATGLYLDKPLINDDGVYRYKYVGNKIIEI